MPNTRLKVGIREAYANAPTDIVILNTLEVAHPTFEETIYIVNNYSDARVRLETGKEVLFKSFSFSLGLPDDSEKPTTNVSLKIENINRRMVRLVESVVQSEIPITITYRPYLSDDFSAPQYDPPLRMNLSGIVISTKTLSAKASFGELGNIQFPNHDYDIEEFPQLVWR